MIELQEWEKAFNKRIASIEKIDYLPKLSDEMRDRAWLATSDIISEVSVFPGGVHMMEEGILSIIWLVHWHISIEIMPDGEDIVWIAPRDNLDRSGSLALPLQENLFLIKAILKNWNEIR